MNLLDRINAFTQLGERLQSLTADEKQLLFDRAKIENPWFIAENVTLALQGISQFLTKDALTKWTSNYSFENVNPKKVGVAMAGNIPLVGFHDLLSVNCWPSSTCKTQSSRCFLNDLRDQLAKRNRTRV